MKSFVFSFCLCITVARETSGEAYWVVRLKSGSVVCGRRIEENERVLVLDIDGFTQTVSKNAILSIDSGKTTPPQRPDEIKQSNFPLPLASTIPDTLKAPPSPESSPKNQVKPQSLTIERQQPQQTTDIRVGTVLPGGLPRPKTRADTVSTPSNVSPDKTRKTFDSAVLRLPPPLQQQRASEKSPSLKPAEMPSVPAVSPSIPSPMPKPDIPQHQTVLQSKSDTALELFDGRPGVTSSSPAITPNVRPKPSSALPGPLRADILKENSASSKNEAQNGISSRSTLPGMQRQGPLPPPPMAPAGSEKRMVRTDGKQELVLDDGTLFIGNIVSQTPRVIIFSSEGASITILKKLVKSIDGQSYRFVDSSGISIPPVKDSATYTHSSRQIQKKPISVNLFRVLPTVNISPGTNVEMLSDSMHNMSDWKCRSRAARQLCAMGPWGAALMQSAVSLLHDTAQSDREVPPYLDSSTCNILLPPGLEAARALSQLGSTGEDELLKALKSGNYLVRRNAVFGLGYCFSESAQKAVITALGDQDASVRRAALGSLRVSSKCLDYLFSALKDPDGGVRATSILLLGKIADRSVIERLTIHTKDNHHDVRKAIAEALGESGFNEAFTALSILSRDKDNLVRAEAVKALGKLKDGNALTLLIDALKDPSADVRAQAAEALGLLRDSRSIPPLYAALKDKDETVRRKALMAIEQLTEISSLIKALDDESDLVRSNAAYVLWLMTGQILGVDKEKWEAWAAANRQTNK